MRIDAFFPFLIVLSLGIMLIANGISGIRNKEAEIMSEYSSRFISGNYAFYYGILSLLIGIIIVGFAIFLLFGIFV